MPIAANASQHAAQAPDMLLRRLHSGAYWQLAGVRNEQTALHGSADSTAQVSTQRGACSRELCLVYALCDVMIFYTRL